MIEALTTSCRPSRSAKKAMTSSGKLPNVTFRKPPMPGPVRCASSSVERPMSAAVGMTPSAAAPKIRPASACDELERDGDRDERDEQVRPARPAEEELRAAESRRRKVATTSRCVRSRAGSIRQRAASSASWSSTLQRSVSAGPSWSGVAPLSSIEPRLSPMPRSSATSLGGRAATGPASRRARRAWPRPARPPGSWMSVGTTVFTGPCARSHAQESWSGVRPWRSATRAHALELLAAAPRSSPAGGTAGGRARRTRARAARRPRTARRSRRRGR